MDTRRYPSVPPLTLASDLSSSGSTVKTQTAVDWDGSALSASSFNTDYIPATLINDARSKIEFILIDATTLANLTTTGATIYKRGLPFHATGNDSTDETESSTRKEFWTQGETKLLIGTNPPWMYGQFANRKNDETITGLWTFPNNANYPLVGTSYTAPTNDLHVATKKYVDDIAIAGAPDATESVKGIVEAATTAEVAAGDDSGTTTAPTFVRPSKLAEVIQNNSYLYAVEDGTGSDDAYTAALTPAISSYTTGQVVAIKFTVANTGACTLALNGIASPRTIKKYAAGALADLETGDIVANQTMLLLNDGTYFVLLNPSGAMPTTANLSAVVAYYLALPTANSWMAGENLTQNDVVKIQNYAGGGEKLYKLRGTVTKQTIPQALADGATGVFLDSTTVLFAEANTSNTSLYVRAYTINATTGALSLIHSLTIGSFFSANSDVRLKSARISSTKAIFLGQGSSGSCKLVAVQLSGGTLTNGSVKGTDGTGYPLGLWNVDGTVVFCAIKQAATDVVVVQSFSESGLVVSDVDTDTTSLSSFGNDGSPSGAFASKIHKNTYVVCANDASVSNNINFAVVTVDDAGSITAGSIQSIATNKFAMVAGYALGLSLYFVMMIDDTEFRRYSVSGTTATLEATTSTSLSISAAEDGFYAFQKSALIFNGALEVVLNLNDLTTRNLPSAFIDIGSTGRFFFPSTADGRYVLASLDDELQIGSFDWGEADGVIAETVTASETTELLKMSYEPIGTLTGLVRGRQYNLTQGGGVSADSTNSTLPIYTAVDETTAIISDVL